MTPLRTDDRFDQQRRDAGRSFIRTTVSRWSMARSISSRGIARVERAAIRERSEEPCDARYAGLVRPAAILARERARTGRRTVKGPVRSEDLVAPANRARKLQRVFVRLAASRGEEDSRALFCPRRDLDDRARQLGAPVVSETRRGVGERRSLRADRRRDGRMRVAEIHRHEPRGEIEIALAVVVV